MTVSMRRMSAGSGYQYLLRSVAAGDGNRVLSTPLTRYYSDVGTPPGRWLGSGVGAFGAQGLGPEIDGDQIGAEQAGFGDRLDERVPALSIVGHGDDDGHD